MSPATAKLLQQYAYSVLPEAVKRKYPSMVGDLQRWLKRWWVREMTHKERGVFRRLAERLGPLPEKFKELARQRGIIIEWPPPPKPKPVRRRNWGKPNSWRAKHYRRPGR
ncbi:MAG: hypothetical protein KAJ19_20740 [Gammaproteobacteria bacterium]|nr:hypothetical protein [Gammaproteobacteria bacterium]